MLSREEVSRELMEVKGEMDYYMDRYWEEKNKYRRMNIAITIGRLMRREDELMEEIRKEEKTN